MKAVIESIEIKHIIEEDGDYSYIGKYSDTWEPGAIIRPSHNPREYKYFIPATSYKEHWKSLHDIGYSRGDCDFMARQYIYEAFRRMEALARGDWYSIGIRAEATVKYPIKNDGYRLETLSSYGLWGIESDSDTDYIKEIEGDQLADLKEHLKAFNVNVRNFNKMIPN